MMAVRDRRKKNQRRAGVRKLELERKSGAKETKQMPK